MYSDTLDNRKDFSTYNKNITSNILKLVQLSDEINDVYSPAKLLSLNPNDIKALDGTLTRINNALIDVKRRLY
jgi:hypothetical protein